MNPRRVLRHAGIQARLRARIGMMPDAYRWQGYVQARDLETAIQKMTATGLGFWVSELARQPNSGEIEQHCQQQLLQMIRFLVRLLPAEWWKAADWLEKLPVVLRFHRSLDAAGLQADDSIAESGRILSGTSISTTLAQYKTHSAESPAENHLSQPQLLETLWLREFSTIRSSLPQLEQAMLDRLIRLLREHQRKQKELVSPFDHEGSINPTRNWELRQELFDSLRLLFAGDPFNTALILVYGAMELIQLERLRAVLLMHCFGWSSRDFSGGFA